MPLQEIATDSGHQHAQVTHSHDPPREYSTRLIVAKIGSEHTNWIQEHLANQETLIYVTDDASAPYTVPKNKGHEAMVILTYIITHYDNLTDISIFTHAHREAWHNNDLMDYQMDEMIRRLSHPHVIRQGYFNLRCHPESGCPQHIDLTNTQHSGKEEEPHFGEAFRTMFGADVEPPRYMSQPCCSQFAASREAIRAIPIQRWHRMREWLFATELEDKISGRIFEFMWQYVFTGKPELFPPINVCYCEGYGICFGSQERLESWLDLRETQYVAQQLYDWKVQANADQGELGLHLNLKLGQRLDSRLKVAQIRGEDPKMRALEGGRTWRQGDGY